MNCPGGNAADPIWRVLASSDGMSSWTPFKPKHSIPFWLSVQWEPRASRSCQCCKNVIINSLWVECSVWPSGFWESQHASTGNSFFWSLGHSSRSSFHRWSPEHQELRDLIWLAWPSPWFSWQRFSFWSSLSILGTNFEKIFRIFSSARIIMCTVPTLTENCALYYLYRHTAVLIHAFFYLVNQLWSIDFLTPPTPLIIPYRLCLAWISYTTQKLTLESCKMPQKQSEVFHTFLWHFFQV